jgi:small subunit ribosomal protein S21e
MQNEEKRIVDLYIPRKCSATNRIIGPTDHASVQINIVDVDENGVAKKTFSTFYIAGKIRAQGISDACLNRLLKDQGVLSFAS